MNYQGTNSVWIIGHKNPDTDSICAAIAYAALKNQTEREKQQKSNIDKLDLIMAALPEAQYSHDEPKKQEKPAEKKSQKKKPADRKPPEKKSPEKKPQEKKPQKQLPKKPEQKQLPPKSEKQPSSHFDGVPAEGLRCVSRLPCARGAGKTVGFD